MVGVGFLVIGVDELYSALTGSGSDFGLFFSWGSISYTLVGAFIIIPSHGMIRHPVNINADA